MSFSKLDRDMIVAEAVALLREEGLGAVSLRRVAARLGVSVSSLYWHVPDKGTLHGLMSASIFRACLDAIPPAGDWRGWLHGFGLALWDAQIAIPDARQLIIVARPQAGLAEASLARILDALEQLGLPAPHALVAQRSVQALVTGWTTLRSVRPDAVAADRDSFVIALDVLIDGWATRVAAEVA
ncbi:TetR/AcrR family transcriptional regulator [Sphingobium lignivorans]|uniref:TetR/AcrR family tetracycline transcriptional repressor n=1 Tax=Sphingobium lignivorans TaxID=2735886 RepID=A0ABR6NB63_9SPHN|nr:TetR family transcriptional regulator [Sphingobium lignivorans]MBB5984520.1 TetR/AcrR family tetracycline transcriptional repressor [Sphingobium lignivorans]